MDDVKMLEQPSWPYVCEHYGLDESFQYSEAQRAEYCRALDQEQAQGETGGHLVAYRSTACGIAVMAGPTYLWKPDLLIGLENEVLSVKGPTEDVVFSTSPSAPWTHDSLLQALDHPDVVCAVNGDVADAYLGDSWIGSTEL